MLILGGSPVALGLPGTVLRVIFWVGLGLVAASFARFGIAALSTGILGC
jgi:hypothetical protein